MSESAAAVFGREDVLVAKGYRLVDRDQQFLLPESMRDWLPASDPVWLVISVVSELDTSGLHARRRIGGAGRAGYDPDMLLTLLIWAWAQGVRSSRVIERLCQRDVAFRIICAGDGPDHVTISRFRGEAAEVMAQLFAQVLVLCARLGMGQVGVVAMDSVKIASDASLAANRTEAGLRELAAAAAAEHAATDASEDALYGPERRGDELPEELIDPRSRAARIAQALQQLQADTAGRVKAAERNRQRQQRARERRQAQLEASGRRRRRRGGAPVMGRPPTEIRVEVLTENLAAVRARHQATIDRWLAGGKRGYPPRPIAESAKVKRVQAALDRAIAERDAHQRLQASWAMKTSGREPKRNVNDPESRMMPLRGGGWVQGYNCQAVTSSDGLIIATSVGNNQSDATAFTTTMDKAVAAAALIDAHRPPPVPPSGIGVLLADAGYLSEDNLSAPGQIG